MIRTLYDDFTKTFGNVLFAVLLLLIWALMTLIGVVVDQGKDPSVYFQSYAAPLARLVLRLNFDNIYHTPYYVGMIGLILISLAVCTFKRVIPARLPPLRPVTIDKIQLHDTFEIGGNEAGIRTAIEHFFSSRGWAVRKREFGGTEWTFADKHNWARRGVLVAHVGFVIIAAGTTVYWAKGYSGDLWITTGQTVSVPHTQTRIRLDDFEDRYQPIETKSGMVYQPMDFVSHVTVSDRDGKPRSQTIRVNHPIDVNGTLYYQSQFSSAIGLQVMHNGTLDPALDRVYVMGDGFTLPGTERSIALAGFVPTVDRRTGRATSDPRVSDPAVAIQLLDSGQVVDEALVSLGSWIDIGGGWRVSPHRYLPVTVLQYRYDPGVALVGIGAFVLLAGLIISFYLLPARLYVRIDPHLERWRVGIAATTVKGFDIFEHEFKELAAQLRAFAEAK